MGKRIMAVSGVDGQVELLADRIVIHRNGFFNALKFGFNARREIPLGAIAEVVFKPPRAMMFGQIEFIRAGRSMDERKKDYSAVKFGKNKQEKFELLKEKIFELVDQYARNKN